MRHVPPPRVVRERWLFLLAALACAATVITLSVTGGPPWPSGRLLWAVLVISFVWLNGLYFLMEVGYPHIQIADDIFVSRIEDASTLVRMGAATFAAIYFVGCLAITVVAVRGAIDG